MTPEVFDSSIVSSILSWLFCVPLLLGILAWLFTVFEKHEGIPRAFSIWLSVCLIVFSPIRYLLFLFAAATCYMFQSFHAFITIFLLALYVPIVFGLLYFIGIGLPMLSLVPILGKSERLTFGRGLAASVALPVACVIGSLLFYLVLPYAGWTVHWLRARDVIRATNGPTALVYRYFASVGTPTRVPGFFDRTPQTSQDLLRCHVAGIYLGDGQMGYFVAHQYPELYREMTERASDK